MAVGLLKLSLGGAERGCWALPVKAEKTSVSARTVKRVRPRVFIAIHSDTRSIAPVYAPFDSRACHPKPHRRDTACRARLKRVTPRHRRGKNHLALFLAPP